MTECAVVKTSASPSVWLKFFVKSVGMSLCIGVVLSIMLWGLAPIIRDGAMPISLALVAIVGLDTFGGDGGVVGAISHMLRWNLIAFALQEEFWHRALPLWAAVVTARRFFLNRLAPFVIAVAVAMSVYFGMTHWPVPSASLLAQSPARFFELMQMAIPYVLIIGYLGLFFSFIYLESGGWDARMEPSLNMAVRNFALPLGFTGLTHATYNALNPFVLHALKLVT